MNKEESLNEVMEDICKLMRDDEDQADGALLEDASWHAACQVSVSDEGFDLVGTNPMLSAHRMMCIAQSHRPPTP